MNTVSPGTANAFSLADLCILADLPIRTARYYIQLGLVDKPEGETRAAKYGSKHLEQLLLIKKWSTSGVSLARIRELLQGEQPLIAPRQPAPGTVEVRSHLTIANGIELVIEPGRAGLSPEQVRRLVRGVINVFKEVSDEMPRDPATDPNRIDEK